MANNFELNDKDIEKVTGGADPDFGPKNALKLLMDELNSGNYSADDCAHLENIIALVKADNKVLAKKETEEINDPMLMRRVMIILTDNFLPF